MSGRRRQATSSGGSRRRSSMPPNRASASCRRKPLWRVSIKVSPEAEEAVTELLSGILGQSVSSYTDVDLGLVTVAAFLPSKRTWSATTRQKLSRGIEFMRRCGLSVGFGKLSFNKIGPRDWANAWKRHFKPLQIGSALLIRSSWARVLRRRGERVVVLDPGLSFGTGQHPTTRFCLEQLVAVRPLDRRKSLLDLGTGSGILAIAAAKLGFYPIKALDLDTEAVAIARANAHRNRVEDKIEFRRADVARLPLRASQHYSVICANLLTPLLLSHRHRIVAHLQFPGRLVVAGILKTEFAQVQAAFQRMGMTLTGQQIEGEWCSGTFAR